MLLSPSIALKKSAKPHFSSREENQVFGKPRVGQKTKQMLDYELLKAKYLVF
jgi:hypothetical protein